LSQKGIDMFRCMEERTLLTEENPEGEKPNGTTIWKVFMKPIFKKGESPEGEKGGYGFPFILKDGKELPEDWHLPDVLTEDDLEHDSNGRRQINRDVWIWA